MIDFFICIDVTYTSLGCCGSATTYLRQIGAIKFNLFLAKKYVLVVYFIQKSDRLISKLSRNAWSKEQ